ncbi:uncharacterized protein [Erythrolamprus reginae]|uniref:uncharacterized protein isoform X3 n=1 Tax=Erythrolamprus reginae TaxID=121349 RepID=UPI00396CB9FB
MARFGAGTALAHLLLLAFLPSRESQPGLRLGERDPDTHASADSKNNIKEIIKYLDQQIQVLHEKNLMHEHEMTEKQSKTFTENMNLVKDVPDHFTYQMLVLNQILQSLKDQKPLLSSEEMQSVMKSILQELKKYTVQNTPPAVEGKTRMLVEQFPTKESQGPERQSSEKENTLMESSSEESLILPASSETSLIFSFTTLPQSIRTEVTNEDVNDARRFEFFEKYEGIQDKKRAKAADLKQLLKHIIIACVAVTGLILVVIVLVHIYNSLFAKKRKPIIANAKTDKKEESEKKKFVKNKESDKPEASEKIEKSETNNMISVEPKTPVYNAIDIENQNNNNCPSPGIFLSTDGEDVSKPLEIQSISSPSYPAKQTELMPYVESFEESPNYSTHKNFKLQSKPFKLNSTSYNNLQQYNTPRNQDYEMYQERGNTSHSKKTDHYLSSSSPKSTEPQRAHLTQLSRHQYYSSLSWGHNTPSDNFIGPNINKNFNESKMSQFDGTECTCFQHHKYDSGTDSYSD